MIQCIPCIWLVSSLLILRIQVNKENNSVNGNPWYSNDNKALLDLEIDGYLAT